jgi:hypothetical protein
VSEMSDGKAAGRDGFLRCVRGFGGQKAIIPLGGGLLQVGKTPRLTFLLARAKVQIDFCSFYFVFRRRRPFYGRNVRGVQVMWAAPLQRELHAPRRVPFEPACAVPRSTPASQAPPPRP